MRISILAAVIFLCLGLTTLARQQQQTQTAMTAPKGTSLLFREDFKAPKPAAAPGAPGAFVQSQFQLTQDTIGNPDLELKLYGPGGKPGTGNQSGGRRVENRAGWIAAIQCVNPRAGLSCN